ncbi:indolethylamine N-methyltransferase-like [Ixodes scapularis]
MFTAEILSRRNYSSVMLGSVESQALIATFKENFVGKSYAALKNGPGNTFHQEELHRIFQSDLAQGKTLLEVGVGPLVWYSFMSSNRFKDIVLSDLVEDNRKELEKWLSKSEDAIDWTYRAEQVAALEGYSDVKKGALEIMERTRSSIRKVVPCNVLEPGVLPEEHRETFDVVLSCNCLEVAGGIRKLLDARELEVKGKKCLVVDPNDGEVRLKLHWLPFHVSDDSVRRALEQYGKVSEITRDTWRGDGFAGV